MQIKEELITPAKAKKYLEKNTDNRVPKKPIIERYSKDIKEDRWKSNTGETIKIAKSGRILDGQHRLLAIVKANKAVSFHVAFDVDDEVFDVIDTGINRTAGDIFHISGAKNATMVSSVIKATILLKQGYKEANQASKSVSPTNSTLLSIYNENPAYWDDVAWRANGYYRNFNRILSPSVIGSIYVLFSKDRVELANDFFSQLSTGLNLTNQSIGLLRNRLTQDKISERKMTPRMKLAFIIKVWNAFVSGKTLQNLRFAPKEEYPVPL